MTDRTDGKPQEPAAAEPTTHGPLGVWRWRTDPARPEAPTIVAFHGWTDGGAVFEGLAASLQRRWPILAIDAPGHGSTPWQPEATYRVQSGVPDIITLLDQLDRDGEFGGPVVLLGHSMGALTAATVASQRPGLVRHLILEEPLKLTRRASRQLSRWRATSNADRWLAWMQNMQSLSHEERVAWASRTHDGWDPAEWQSWARTKGEVDISHLTVPVDFGPPLVEILPSVQCSVTMIRGRWHRGSIITRREVRECQAATPRGIQEVILPVGHNPRRDAPGAFAQALRGVLMQYDSQGE